MSKTIKKFCSHPLKDDCNPCTFSNCSMGGRKDAWDKAFWAYMGSLDEKHGIHNEKTTVRKTTEA